LHDPEKLLLSGTTVPKSDMSASTNEFFAPIEPTTGIDGLFNKNSDEEKKEALLQSLQVQSFPDGNE
jgi:hypothetical protein